MCASCEFQKGDEVSAPCNRGTRPLSLRLFATKHYSHGEGPAEYNHGNYSGRGLENIEDMLCDVIVTQTVVRRMFITLSLMRTLLECEETGSTQT